MAPQRIQRRCTPGWRIPAGTIYVGRPSTWHNPYQAVRCRSGNGWMVTGRGQASRSADDDAPWTRLDAAEFAVESFRNSVPQGSFWAWDIATELGGRDLCCWCPLEQSCHADVLLEIANGGTGDHL